MVGFAEVGFAKCSARKARTLVSASFAADWLYSYLWPSVRITRLKSSAPQGPAHDFGQARLEKIDLRTDDEDVAEPDWVLQPVATGPATARTADIGTGAIASAS